MPNKSLKASFYKAITNVKIRANLSAAKPYVTGLSLLCEIASLRSIPLGHSADIWSIRKVKITCRRDGKVKTCDLFPMLKGSSYLLVFFSGQCTRAILENSRML